MTDHQCSLVNLTASSPANWILDLILDQEDTQVHDENYNLNLKTKYYNATVKLKHFTYADLSNKQCQHFECTEALLLYCDTTSDSLEKAEDVWILAKEHDPAVCLLIVDSTEERVEEGAGQVSRTEIVSWCLKHNFELIESDEVDESEPGEIGDIVGKCRILEALKSHTWSTMQIIPSPADQQKQEKKESQNLEESIDSFEVLFAELATIKAKADNLPPDERKAYAEKIALSFYAAMGGSDDED